MSGNKYKDPNIPAVPLQNVSHEMIDFLTAVKTSLDSLTGKARNTDLSKAARMKDLADIQENIDRLDLSITEQVEGYPTIVTVASIDDFPKAVSGIITLEANTLYYMIADVSTADRFVVSSNSCIMGESLSSGFQKFPVITYTGTGNMLTMEADGNVFRNVKLVAASGTLFDVDDSASGYKQRFYHCFIDAANIGTIACDSIHFFDCSITIDTTGFLFSGSFSELLFHRCIMDVDGGTAIDLQTATFDNVEIIGCNVDIASGTTFLDGAASNANINSGMLGKVLDNHIEGSGTSLATILTSDTRWIFKNNNTITDTSSGGLTSSNIVFVSTIDDFPADSGGYITLATFTTYVILEDIILDATLKMQRGTKLIGAFGSRPTLTPASSSIGAMVEISALYYGNDQIYIENLHFDCDGMGANVTHIVFGPAVEVWINGCFFEGGLIAELSTASYCADHIYYNSCKFTPYYSGGHMTCTGDGTDIVKVLQFNGCQCDGQFLDLGSGDFRAVNILYCSFSPGSGKYVLKGETAGGNIATNGLGRVIGNMIYYAAGSGSPLNTIASGDSKWIFRHNNYITDS